MDDAAPCRLLPITALPWAISATVGVMLLAGCAQPGGPVPQAAGAGGAATVCAVVGPVASVVSPRTSPAMSVSSDGFCNVRFGVTNAVGTAIRVMSQPQHGQLEVGGNGVNTYLRYHPTPGYEGPDSFTVNTGVTNGTTAEFAVTVLKP